MIESLENRIAPAAVISFTEVDGDKVTIKTSKGTSAALDAIVDVNNGDVNVTEFAINFVEDGTGIFEGTNVTITVKTGSVGGVKGNGLADEVVINAFDSNGLDNIDLGTINIKGNLAYIDAGNENLLTPAIKKITVTNWQSQDANAISSQIRGDITSIVVKENFNGYIISNDAAGQANFGDLDATIIGSFQAKNIASFDGENVGHIQVGAIAKLMVKDTFFGSGPNLAGNGLIEAVSISKMSINQMSLNAQIVLSQGPV
ncbi:MAG TPA: hypothetical protein VF593_12305 [Chthoniobacteraceae bacterium]|jgi:hypothetical protein